mmetsp:Transcript_6511/g.14258  ORF Transcript_6511/g.14258 Transcript_6511/m.14258 type:complete len:128 (+) Transcript_6511:3361-3744(+)
MTCSETTARVRRVAGRNQRVLRGLVQPPRAEVLLRALVDRGLDQEMTNREARNPEVREVSLVAERIPRVHEGAHLDPVQGHEVKGFPHPPPEMKTRERSLFRLQDRFFMCAAYYFWNEWDVDLRCDK